MDALESWFEHPALLWGLGGFSVLAVVGSIVLVPRYLASFATGSACCWCCSASPCCSCQGRD
jgi:hypothetical protein